MWPLIKKNHRAVITAIMSIVLCFYLYSCESKVLSLNGDKRFINRAELQLQLSQYIGTAEVRMLDLDHQDRLRDIIIQNGLLVVSGQPFNPLGLATAVFGLYGTTHGVSKVIRAVNKRKEKRNGGKDTA